MSKLGGYSHELKYMKELKEKFSVGSMVVVEWYVDRKVLSIQTKTFLIS
jgi:hypothetical protein